MNGLAKRDKVDAEAPARNVMEDKDTKRGKLFWVSS